MKVLLQDYKITGIVAVHSKYKPRTDGLEIPDELYQEYREAFYNFKKAVNKVKDMYPEATTWNG